MVTNGISAKRFERREVVNNPVIQKLKDELGFGESYSPYPELLNKNWSLDPSSREPLTKGATVTSRPTLTQPSSIGDDVMRINMGGQVLREAYRKPALRTLRANDNNNDEALRVNELNNGLPMGRTEAEFRSLNVREVADPQTGFVPNGVPRSTFVPVAPEREDHEEHDHGPIVVPKKKAADITHYGSDGKRALSAWQASYAGGRDIHGITLTGTEFTHLKSWYERVFFSPDAARPAMFDVISVEGHARPDNRVHAGYDLVPTESTQLKFSEPGLYGFETAGNGARFYFIPLKNIQNVLTEEGVAQLNYGTQVVNGKSIRTHSAPSNWVSAENGAKSIAFLHMNDIVMKEVFINAFMTRLSTLPTQESYSFHKYGSGRSWSLLTTSGISSDLLCLTADDTFPAKSRGEDHYHVEFADVLFNKNGNITFKTYRSNTFPFPGGL